MQKQNAIIITAGYLDSSNGKTAHGLIRGTDRFTIMAVIDDKHAGKDAGEVLDGKKRNIPVYESIEAFLKSGKQATYCIVGVATKGGVIPTSLRVMLKEALQQNFNLVNGLHEYISDISELADLAKVKNLEIIDVRMPKKFKDLHFWSGKIKEAKCLKIAVLESEWLCAYPRHNRFLTQQFLNTLLL